MGYGGGCDGVRCDAGQHLAAFALSFVFRRSVAMLVLWASALVVGRPVPAWCLWEWCSCLLVAVIVVFWVLGHGERLVVVSRSLVPPPLHLVQYK